jgi:hypothetical protein
MKSLPAQPSLTQLKHQAKDLRRASSGSITLASAQHGIAREYGFINWSALKRHVELVTGVEARVARLQTDFAAADPQTKRRLLKPAHDIGRFRNYDPDAASLLYDDARLLVANEEGYAFWNKYESFLYLDPSVQVIIAAARSGDLAKLQQTLDAEPAAANPKWVTGYAIPNPAPNDSIPLFCISEAAFRGTNRAGNEYAMTRALIAAGADPEAERGQPLTAAVSFGAIDVVKALLDSGVRVDGVDGDGVPMAYAMHFGFSAIAELLAERGAQLDLRFAAGLGRLDLVKGWFNADGTLRPGAGALSDPYGYEWKARGASPLRCERTRENILSQALCFTAIHGRLEAAEFLLSQGADINAIVPGLDSRATVLHQIATRKDGAPVARFLLARGANPGIRDEHHHATPADWARYFKNDDLASLL